MASENWGRTFGTRFISVSPTDICSVSKEIVIIPDQMVAKIPLRYNNIGCYSPETLRKKWIHHLNFLVRLISMTSCFYQIDYKLLFGTWTKEKHGLVVLRRWAAAHCYNQEERHCLWETTQTPLVDRESDSSETGMVQNSWKFFLKKVPKLPNNLVLGYGLHWNKKILHIIRLL